MAYGGLRFARFGCVAMDVGDVYLLYDRNRFPPLYAILSTIKLDID